MSWDGIYAQDRHYPQFEVGDEVFTTKESWKAIIEKSIILLMRWHLIEELN